MLNVDLIERNERAFNGIERLNQALKHSFLYTLVNWARVFIEDHDSCPIGVSADLCPAGAP